MDTDVALNQDHQAFIGFDRYNETLACFASRPFLALQKGEKPSFIYASPTPVDTPSLPGGANLNGDQISVLKNAVNLYNGVKPLGFNVATESEIKAVTQPLVKQTPGQTARTPHIREYTSPDSKFGSIGKVKWSCDGRILYAASVPSNISFLHVEPGDNVQMAWGPSTNVNIKLMSPHPVIPNVLAVASNEHLKLLMVKKSNNKMSWVELGSVECRDPKALAWSNEGEQVLVSWPDTLLVYDVMLSRQDALSYWHPGSSVLLGFLAGRKSGNKVLQLHMTVPLTVDITALKTFRNVIICGFADGKIGFLKDGAIKDYLDIGWSAIIKIDCTKDEKYALVASQCGSIQTVDLAKRFITSSRLDASGVMTGCLSSGGNFYAWLCDTQQKASLSLAYPLSLEHCIWRWSGGRLTVSDIDWHPGTTVIALAVKNATWARNRPPLGIKIIQFVSS